MALGILKSPVSEGDSNPYSFGRDIAGWRLRLSNRASENKFNFEFIF